MEISVTFHGGVLGPIEFVTDSEHGHADGLFVDGVDFSKNGPAKDFLIMAIGTDKYLAAVARAREACSRVDDSSVYKSRRDLELERGA